MIVVYYASTVLVLSLFVIAVLAISPLKEGLKRKAVLGALSLVLVFLSSHFGAPSVLENWHPAFLVLTAGAVGASAYFIPRLAFVQSALAWIKRRLP